MLPRTPIECVRNFGIVAHVDAGKTTLTERILHATGRIHAFGSVDDGNTVTDHDPRERARGITIGAAAVTTAYAGHSLSLIDTPGHIDFGVEVERSLRVLDGAVVVIDAASGVEPQTESVWAAADRHEIPRVAFINKIDHPGADFDRAVLSMEETFGVVVVPLVVPAPSGLRLVDLVHLTLIEPGGRSGHTSSALPSDLVSFASARRERIVEACAAFDEGVLEAFVLGEPISPELLLTALRRGTLSRQIVPCVGGSAKVGLGITHLLDHIIALLPSPLDRAGVHSSAGTTHVPSPQAPLVAYCFKGVHDGYGQRTFIRVYSGTLRRGASVVAGRTQKRLRVGRLVRIFADAVEDLESAYPGDIAAVIGAPLATGETLSDEGVTLEGLDLREPVVGVALELRTSEARNRLAAALKRVLDEDPSLSVSTDPETGQTVLRGQGELHLEVTLDKIRQDHGVEIKASPPRVAYRETITQSAELEVRHVKQSGGPGQFACVVVRVEPAPAGVGISFIDASEGGVIPRAFVPAVEAGVREAAAAGGVFGHPVDDIVVTLVGGSFHSNDSSEMAFAIAGRKALLDGERLASPVVLEPIMQLEIVSPETRLGDVLGDLAARRGRVEKLGARGTQRIITARAPLAELIGYVTALRSRTEGRGTVSMTLAGYEAVR